MISSSKLWQTYAAFASGFGCFILGSLTVWSSYVSPLYSSNSTTLLTAPITKFEDSLLGSIPSLGSVVGTMFATTVLDKFGRRNGGILLSLPYVISWVVIGISSSINVILFARFLGGVAGGSAVIFAPILVSEVSEDTIRGFLASVSTFLYSVGILFSYIIGLCFSYRTVIWINITLSVAGISFIMFMEESPTYLIRKRRLKEAKKAIARYQGKSMSSVLGVDEMSMVKQLTKLTANSTITKITDTSDTPQLELREKLNRHDLQHENNQSITSFNLLFFEAASRRAFLVLTMLITFMVFMGLMPVQVYANVIFKERDPSNSDLHTIVFAIVQVVAAFISAIGTDMFGRRVLQIGSSVIVSICLAVLGFITQFEVALLHVTVILMNVYNFFFTVGAGAIPFVLFSEVFSPEVINLASMLIIEWMWLLIFIIIAIFPYITNLFGIYGAFYGFGIVSLVNAIFSYYVLPETAGLSHEQIRDLFLYRKI